MLKLTLFANILVIAVAADRTSFKTVYEWKFPNYNWPSIDILTEALDCGKYIPKNNAIFGIKLWKDRMYLTVPRRKNGVPVTLATISATPQNGITNPLLDPYPSWDMQTEGNCSAFQSVQSMEIDPLGRMWVLDTGRTEISKCPPRLVILDLKNNGAILRTYVFPKNVASYDSVTLNDIVLDHEDGGTAFITDSESSDPGIIVYSLKQNVSWKVRNNRSMRVQAEALGFIVAGTRVSMSSSVNGIALSSPGPNRVLYYSPLSSFHVYSIPVSVLKNSSLKEVDHYVTDLGVKSSQSGGMVMSNQGVLYMVLLNDDAIAMWDSKNSPSFADGLKVIFRDHVRSQWPDTFAFDQNGNLLYVSNKLQNFLTGSVDITKPNYRVLSGNVQAKSYQYRRDGTTPKFPAIAEAANQRGGSEHCESGLH